MRAVCPLVLLLAAACDRGSGPTTSPAASAASTAAKSPPTAGSTDEPTVVTTNQSPTDDAALLKRLCKDAACAGPFSLIDVYRDSDQAPQVFVFRGDLRRCSHPPTSYFNATGKKIFVQANKPVVPGSAEATRFEEEQQGGSGWAEEGRIPFLLQAVQVAREVRCWFWGRGTGPIRGTTLERSRPGSGHWPIRGTTLERSRPGPLLGAHRSETENPRIRALSSNLR